MLLVVLAAPACARAQHESDPKPMPPVAMLATQAICG